MDHINTYSTSILRNLIFIIKIILPTISSFIVSPYDDSQYAITKDSRKLKLTIAYNNLPQIQQSLIINPLENALAHNNKKDNPQANRLTSANLASSI